MMPRHTRRWLLRTYSWTIGNLITMFVMMALIQVFLLPSCVTLDGRMIAQLRVKPPSEKRMKVFEFLEWMWRTCAEPVPDEYASSKMPHRLSAGKQKKKKNCEGVRQLPPGSLQDYYKLCVADHPEERISYNLWSSVSGMSIVDLRLVYVELTCMSSIWMMLHGHDLTDWFDLIEWVI